MLERNVSAKFQTSGISSFGDFVMNIHQKSKKKRSTASTVSPEVFLTPKKHQMPYILLVGGLNPKNLQTAGIGGAVLNYVPSKKKWMRYSTIPQARCNHCVAYHNDQLYVIGGCDPKDTATQMPHRAKNTCYRLHIRTVEWEEIEPMSYRRYDHAAAILDRYIFVIGGQDDGERLLKNMEVFDTKKDIWKQLSTEMCCGRKSMGAIGYKRKIWIAGGLIQLDNDASFQIVSHVDCYDPKIKKWFYCLNLLPSPRLHHSLAEWNGVICCVGGMTQTSVKDTRVTDEVLFLDDAASTWSAGPSLPAPRLAAGAVVFQNVLYVVGGFNPEAELLTKNVYYLTQTADTWEVAAPLPAQLYGCSVASVP